MNPATCLLSYDPLIKLALQEDIPSEDISTQAVMPHYCLGSVQLISKDYGIIAGLDVFERTFTLLDSHTQIKFHVSDGDAIEPAEHLATLTGDIRVLLSGERVALNYLQRMSGIATLTHKMCSALQGTNTQLVDTRKTTPNMRIFEKEAVRIGGGHNHRLNLSDGVMLKDNHIDAAGSITCAVKQARERAPFVRKIEVECETLEQVKESLACNVDIIMLDNMDYILMKKALHIIDGRAQTEASGNITLDNLKKLADLGVDFISSGALTHSAPILDLSLKHLHVLEQSDGE